MSFRLNLGETRNIEDRDAFGRAKHLDMPFYNERNKKMAEHMSQPTAIVSKKFAVLFKRQELQN